MKLDDRMNVTQLIDILKKLPGELPITTHAVNHTSGRGDIRVCLLKGAGWARSVSIGDFSRKHINYPNDFVVMELDNLGLIPMQWGERDEDVEDWYDFGDPTQWVKDIDEKCKIVMEDEK